MKLYYAPQSPFARKARAAAIELGLGDRLELEYAEVVPGRPGVLSSQSPNPLRKIPALLTDANEVIFDSTVICEYLDAIAGGGLIIPEDLGHRWQVLTGHAVAQGMCESVVLIRYETWLRPEEVRWPVWIEDHWRKIDSGLAWFEKNEQEQLRQRVNVAHLALGSLLGYVDFRWPDRVWRAAFPHVADWFAEIERRPSFQGTKPCSMDQR